jgi:hypothetical protein
MNERLWVMYRRAVGAAIQAGDSDRAWRFTVWLVRVSENRPVGMTSAEWTGVQR